MNTWAVKDTDGALSIVTASEFEVSSNGLVFFLEGIKVAWFVRLASFWLTTTALYLPAAPLE